VLSSVRGQSLPWPGSAALPPDAMNPTKIRPCRAFLLFSRPADKRSVRRGGLGRAGMGSFAGGNGG
jgi:hypothetical protein